MAPKAAIALAALSIVSSTVATNVYYFSNMNCDGAAFAYYDSNNDVGGGGYTCQSIGGYGGELQSLLWAPDNRNDASSIALHTVDEDCDGNAVTYFGSQAQGNGLCIGNYGFNSFEVSD